MFLPEQVHDVPQEELKTDDRFTLDLLPHDDHEQQEVLLHHLKPSEHKQYWLRLFQTHRDLVMNEWLCF